MACVSTSTSYGITSKASWQVQALCGHSAARPHLVDRTSVHCFYCVVLHICHHLFVWCLSACYPQVPGCAAPLTGTHISPYFRRHRVCMTHAKADTVVMNGKSHRCVPVYCIMHVFAAMLCCPFLCSRTTSLSAGISHLKPSVLRFRMALFKPLYGPCEVL